MTKTKVSLPEEVSLQRVAQVLIDAWEADSHQWNDSALQLREGHMLVSDLRELRKLVSQDQERRERLNKPETW